MNSKLWIQKTLSLGLMVALGVTCSMVALASPGAVAGELTVTGGNNDNSFVTVNGETATSGRTVFVSSTISTSGDAGALINFGKAGKIEFTPGTTFTLSSAEESISGELASGSITVLNAAHTVNVRIPSGEIIELNAGESATTTSSAKQTNNSNSKDKLVIGLIFAGAAAAIIWAVTSDNNDQFGSQTVTTSPVR